MTFYDAKNLHKDSIKMYKNNVHNFCVCEKFINFVLNIS